jgi:hypothetical protein
MKNMPSYAWNKDFFFKSLSSLIPGSAGGIHLPKRKLNATESSPSTLMEAIDNNRFFRVSQ